MTFLGQDAAGGALPSLYAATGAVASGEFFGPSRKFNMNGLATRVRMPKRANVNGAAPGDVADVIAVVVSSFAAQPLLCELRSIVSPVLERNLSVDAIVRAKTNLSSMYQFLTTSICVTRDWDSTGSTMRNRWASLLQDVRGLAINRRLRMAILVVRGGSQIRECGRYVTSTSANVVYPLESIVPPLPGLGLNCSP